MYEKKEFTVADFNKDVVRASEFPARTFWGFYGSWFLKLERVYGDIAQDIIQEIMISVIRKIRKHKNKLLRYPSEGNYKYFRKYIVGIAYNYVRKIYREQTRIVFIEELSQTSPALIDNRTINASDKALDISIALKALRVYTSSLGLEYLRRVVLKQLVFGFSRKNTIIQYNIPTTTYERIKKEVVPLAHIFKNRITGSQV